MRSILLYLNEGKVKDHFKRNVGKYLTGAAITTLAVPELAGSLIQKSASNDSKRLVKNFIDDPLKTDQHKTALNNLLKKDELGGKIRPSSYINKALDNI